ncbi:twin-arginine translocation signal domain-containing protein [Burkholderia gladioli]|uniref:twin-arginine translocation signal domain-containing protein n=1 Tax=Burkholderia gladioli TaxID=28095 RepID=UPI00163E42A0|nr:twin-arginine translocation signal domain-containing protein [Burkholderia gladioli]
MQATRRGFLKLVGAASVLLGLPNIDQKIAAFRSVRAHPSAGYDWIVEHPDYFHIRIPEGKTLARVDFPKPCLIEFGRYSTLAECRVKGFANAYGDWFALRDIQVDARQMLVKDDIHRPALRIVGSNASLYCCMFDAPHGTGVEFVL